MWENTGNIWGYSYSYSTHTHHEKLLFIRRRRRRREILQRPPPPPPPPSVCPSVTFSFCTVTQKRMAVFSWKLAGNVHQVLGVCCIVFDIDGMLLELFMNFLNIEKNKILRIFFCKISCFLRVSCYFPQWLGGGGGVMFFSHFMLFTTFLEKNSGNTKKDFFISHLMFSSCFFMLEILKSSPSLTG